MDGRAKAKKNGYWGYIDEYGNTLIPFEFDGLGDFVDGRARAEKNGHRGFIGEDGNMLIPFEFDGLGDFVDGRAEAKKNGYWGFIGEDGNMLIPFEFDGLWNFVDGRAKAKKNGYWGYIDEGGKTRVPFEYDELEAFVDGRAKAKKNGCWGYIDEYGNMLIPFEYDVLENFVDGRAKAMKNGYWGYIDEEGKTRVPFEYDIIWSNFMNGRVQVQKNRNLGIIDEDGNEIYKRVNLSNGLIRYESNFLRKYGLMSSDGNKITDLEYDELEDFVRGLARAKKERKWGYINESGEIIAPFEYNWIGIVGNKIIGKVDGNKHVVKDLNPRNPIDLSKLEWEKVYVAKVTGAKDFGVFINIQDVGDGLITARTLERTGRSIEDFEKGKSVKVMLQRIDGVRQRATFKLVREKLL